MGCQTPGSGSMLTLIHLRATMTLSKSSGDSHKSDSVFTDVFKINFGFLFFGVFIDVCNEF